MAADVLFLHAIMETNSQAKSTQPSGGRRTGTTEIAATGLFAALAIILTLISQALVLSFPLIPYLQFDFGEVAIILALLMFGPAPATGAALVEFLTLMVLGVNAPFGPILKLVAILASIAGIWAGIRLTASRNPNSSTEMTRNISRRGLVLGSGLGFGLLSRGLVLTVANYLLLLYIYNYPNTIGYLSSFFNLIGLSLNVSNGWAIILGFTGVFNCLQLVLVFMISYALLRFPQLGNSFRKSRKAWYLSAGKNSTN